LNKTHVILPASLILLASCQDKQNKPKEASKPNIVYILADDLGYGDLSCYGQKKFSTPNIDKLAESGIKFIQHYSGSTVSAPSRSSLLTGQHTGNTFIRGNKAIQPEGQHPLKAEEVTLAEVLSETGYVTGAFGKWGLGYPGSEGDPNNQGFDEFYGYNCQRMAHHYYPYHMWHNQEIIIIKENAGQKTGQYGPDLIHQKALRFMEDNKDKPFFMFYPSLIPHAEMFAPEEYMEKHRGKYEPENSYEGVDGGENFRKGSYGSQPEAHAATVAMINVLDDQVGEIVEKLKALGIHENTLIIFSSDNGPHLEGGADPDYFNSNSIFRGYKRDLYEGGIRVPMIAAWEGKIAPGTETNHVSAFWDVFPTLAEIANVPIPGDVDGISFLPTLLGENDQEQHDFLYWEFHEKGGRMALRKDDWKLVKYNVFDPAKTTVELYNLKTDPGEKNNVADEYPAVLKELKGLMDDARTESDIFTFKQKTIIE
jgi:arylsulfatase A